VLAWSYFAPPGYASIAATVRTAKTTAAAMRSSARRACPGLPTVVFARTPGTIPP
jgi:hypothetical protein